MFTLHLYYFLFFQSALAETHGRQCVGIGPSSPSNQWFFFRLKRLNDPPAIDLNERRKLKAYNNTRVFVYIITKTAAAAAAVPRLLHSVRRERVCRLHIVCTARHICIYVYNTHRDDH